EQLEVVAEALLQRLLRCPHDADRAGELLALLLVEDAGDRLSGAGDGLPAPAGRVTRALGNRVVDLGLTGARCKAEDPAPVGGLPRVHGLQAAELPVAGDGDGDLVPVAPLDRLRDRVEARRALAVDRDDTVAGAQPRSLCRRARADAVDLRRADELRVRRRE